ncbi:conserved hypothetical protein [Vibrio nigripulchritudo SOn1]|uniref:Uncharacterized protein n=1 Tax=Vibrio nigripulchritudo SOn1 TaxID=1238450 RepID=A0AAV2W1Q6_9VIBR|nr:hypothetical protein [Vibrio nigripulchritudo]CCO50316.1 conserved hypothetical protein [Vibrio nigripulchritudo SOn1]
MMNAICTYGGKRKMFHIFHFQQLSESDIERYRQHLECPNPKCAATAYFRRASVDGKSACFGSRYHVFGCSEGRASLQLERATKHVREVEQIIEDSEAVVFDFSTPTPKKKLSLVQPSKSRSAGPSAAQFHAGKVTGIRNPVLDMEKALDSLMLGSSLAQSDTIITIDGRYPYKAKNLFVNFADTEPEENLKTVHPKMFWGTISHCDAAMEWLNPAGCDDVGIPIKKHRDKLFKRFDIVKAQDVEGAGIILFGKCFWNAQKSRKIIDLWNENRIYMSFDEH